MTRRADDCCAVLFQVTSTLDINIFAQQTSQDIASKFADLAFAKIVQFQRSNSTSKTSQKQPPATTHIKDYPHERGVVDAALRCVQSQREQLKIRAKELEEEEQRLLARNPLTYPSRIRSP
jgi:hypothetical protein